MKIGQKDVMRKIYEKKNNFLKLAVIIFLDGQLKMLPS